MTHDVRLGPRAIEDLQAIYDYIATQADFGLADAYIARIEAACAALADFPRRGQPRDDLAPGLRTIAFERRATIAYGIDGATVTIQRVLHRGRDLGGAFD